jgi:hypothetical protein
LTPHRSDLAIEDLFMSDLDQKVETDRSALAIRLLNFDVELTGFETGEIDFLLHDADEAKGETAGPEDDVPEPQPDRIVSKLGDLWALGKHRLLCGDARSMACYEQLLDVEKAELVITDPPYNVAIDGHVTGKGAIRHRDFVMASGEMSKEAFTEFLTTVFCCLVAHTTNGSIHYAFMDWRHLEEIMAAGRQAYTEFKNLHLDKDQCRHGELLPQSTRTRLRMEVW